MSNLRGVRYFWFGVMGSRACFHLVAEPTIQITNLPLFGSSQDLGGTVSDADPALHRVAVFVFVPGAGWYTKPTCGSPLTTIQPDGSWLTDITTGGSDPLATKIAALLVTNTYNEPCVLGPPTLPTSVTARAIASVIVHRDDPSIRRFDFGGYNWWVKSSPNQVGPGPNYFSDSTNNVWLDGSNRLHLRITYRSNSWQCAEVVTRRSFGHGHYRFQLDSRVDNLNPNVVLGLFTWSDDPAYTHREIDVECSRWGNTADPTRAQFVVQPYDLPGHFVRFIVPTNAMSSAHVFAWETNRVVFQSQLGTFTPQPAGSNVISEWTYTNAVPPAGDENVRLNLWLNQGNAPSDGAEVEVVIRNFRFVPFGELQPARFTHIALGPGGGVEVVLSVESERFYEIQSSTNLINWQTVAEIQATNLTIAFVQASHPAPAAKQFFRAVTLP